MLDLRKIRKESNLTETALSVKVGITQQHYNYIENGKRRPSVDVAQKIASVLGFDWTLFFEDSGLFCTVGG